MSIPFTCRTGTILRLIREDLNLPVRTLGKQLNIPPTTINAWEIGRNKPNKDMLDLTKKLWLQWITQKAKINPKKNKVIMAFEGETYYQSLARCTYNLIDRSYVQELLIADFEKLINLKYIATYIHMSHLAHISLYDINKAKNIVASDILQNFIDNDHEKAREAQILRLSLCKFEPINYIDNRSYCSNNKPLGLKMVFSNLSDAIDALVTLTKSINIEHSVIKFTGIGTITSRNIDQISYETKLF